MEEQQKDIFRIRLREYDHIGEVANFSFVGSSGKIETFTIHIDTFKRLVSKGAWDINKFGSQTEQQKKFLAAVKTEVKGDLVKWFEEITNEFMRQRTKGTLS